MRKLSKIQEIKIDHKKLIKMLPNSINGFDISIKSKIPFKVEILKGVLLHRISDLCGTVLQLIDKRKKLESIILIRALQESTALLYYLFINIKKVCEEKKVNKIDNIIMKLLFGSKIKPSKEEAVNILTAIDKSNTFFPDFRKNYDILSEFAHPNCAGTFIAFGKLDELENTFYFGGRKKDKLRNIGINTLQASLLFTIIINEDMNNLKEEFIKICENDNQKLAF